MIFIDALVCLLVFVIGYNLKNRFSGFTKWDIRIINKLYWFHLLIAVVFSLYISTYGGDAQHYWQASSEIRLQEIIDMLLLGSPRGTIYFLNYLPSNVLGLSFFTGNMIYSQLGFFGFLLIYAISKHYFGNFSSLKKIKIFNIPIFPWLLFMPNMHFWSSGIGKDTLLFFCIAVFIYGLIKIKKRFFWIIFSLVLATAVRPHITLFLIVAFLLGNVFDAKFKGYQKTFLIIVIVTFMVPLVLYVLNFAKLESFETETINEFATTKAANLNQERSGSGVDTSEYSYPLKVLTFLYRPLFFDINNALAIIASFENLVLVIFTIKIFKNRLFKALRNSDYIIKGSLFYFGLGTLALSLILGNLGIMMRQKNMFVPWLILFGFWVFHYSYKTIKN